MAGVQLGDIVQVGRWVWELYNLGWTEELSAGESPSQTSKTPEA
jgi:hypothetical protein